MSITRQIAPVRMSALLRAKRHWIGTAVSAFGGQPNSFRLVFRTASQNATALQNGYPDVSLVRARVQQLLYAIDGYAGGEHTRLALRLMAIPVRSPQFLLCSARRAATLRVVWPILSWLG